MERQAETDMDKRTETDWLNEIKLYYSITLKTTARFKKKLYTQTFR